MAKERHWTLTATLVIIGLANVLLAVTYIFFAKAYAESGNFIESSLIPWLSVISVLSVICIGLLFNWKKIGLVGLSITSIGNFMINYSNGTRFPELLFSFVGIIVIVLVLQIKRKGRSGWSNLN